MRCPLTAETLSFSVPSELRATLRVNNQRLGEVLAELKGRGVLCQSQRGWSISGARETTPT